jgi:O-succinylhomoserine sulfhydrylase
MAALSRGDLAGRLAATLNKSLKDRGRNRVDRLRRGRFFCFWWTPNDASALTTTWRPATQLVHGGNNPLPVWRDLRGHLPDAGLRLRDGGGGRGTLQGRERRLSSMPATAARPTTCSRSACACWKVRRMRAPWPRAWPRSRQRSFAKCKAGDHIVAARALFGSCRWVVETLAPKYGVECTLVDGRDLANWERAVRKNTKVFFLESPTNPTLEVIDIAGVAKLANQAGAKVVVDNVFATPLFSRSRWSSARMSSSIPRPSTSTDRAAASAASSFPTSEWIERSLHDYFRHTGPCLSPFNAWTLLKGLETLPLRVRQQTESAGRIADLLANHPKVAGHLSRPRGPSAGRHHRQADDWRLDADLPRTQGWQVAGLRIAERAGDREDLQQSGRRQEPDHPSGTTTHKNLTDEARPNSASHRERSGYRRV